MTKHLCILSVCIALLTGCAAVDYRTRTSTAHLPTDRASHFYSNHLTGSGYIEFNTDGTYRQIAREHMGVWPFDVGTWSQNQDGVVTLVSTVMCADVISPPLEVMVGRSEYLADLPELQKAIQAFLSTNTASRFEVPDCNSFIVTEGEYDLGVEANYLLERRFVSRAELKQLISAIDLFLRDPEQQHCQAVPLQYKDRVFLLWLNCNTPICRSLSEICSDIDEAKPGHEVIYYDFLIPEEQFEKEVKKPYPFMFYPEMNKITGAEEAPNNRGCHPPPRYVSIGRCELDDEVASVLILAE